MDAAPDASVGNGRSFRSVVDLLGPGWWNWRGSWGSDLRLVGARDGSWVLIEGSRERRRFADLSAAFRELWSNRSVRGERPWMVGWLGYEACAALAGDLPSHSAREDLPSGVMLIEPKPVPLPSPPGTGPVGGCDGLRSSLDASQFEGMVEAIRDTIAVGAVYQVNLSRRWTAEGWVGTLDPFVEASRAGGTPDYLAHFRCVEGELVTASMELLVRRRGQDLETMPIKGTRPRGDSAEQDRQLVADLAADPKERAELAMIVDLERNDLGRVSEIGSIRVEDEGSVSTYPSIHHRVAKVTGRLRENLEWWDVLAAMVPGGSVTGCPKHAAMSVIAQLEPVARGPFTGALGVVAGNGEMEMALPIRSVWLTDRGVELAAGCGIVWESDPAAEERESRLKVARWLEMVGGAR